MFLKFNGIFHFVLLMVTGAVLFFSPSAVLSQNDVVSFNTATVRQLMAIKGIDVPETVARAIVLYREKNGPFTKATDLRAVPGMSSDLFKELNPVTSEDGSDVLYDQDTEPEFTPLKT